MTVDQLRIALAGTPGNRKVFIKDEGGSGFLVEATLVAEDFAYPLSSIGEGDWSKGLFTKGSPGDGSPIVFIGDNYE